MAAFLRRLARTNLLKKARNLATISFPIAHCKIKDDYNEQKVDMSHQALIRQACTLTVNSSSQLLTHMLVAIAEASETYRKSISELMQILEDSVLILSSGNSNQQDDISEMILVARTAVEANRKALRDLNGLMDYVEKLATSTAETAFLAGAENSSTIICEHLNSALQKVKEELDANKKAEEDLLVLQHTYITQVAESTKNASGNSLKSDQDCSQPVEEPVTLESF